MSAPKQAYKSKSIVINGIRHNCTKLQVSEATHKSRFYLDGYVSSGEGIVGFVEIGGENANMHNLTKRGGSGRAMHGGKMVRMLNDGGLNTKGLSGDTQSHLVYRNFVTLRLSPKSAWYLDSNDFGFEIKTQNQTWAQAEKFSFGYISKAIQLPLKYYLIRPNNFGDGSVNIRAFVSNIEGVNYSNEISATLAGLIDQIIGQKRESACDTSGENEPLLLTSDAKSFIETFSSTSDTATGVFLYKGAPVENPINESTGDLIPADGGWYAYLTDDSNKVIQLSSQGEVRRVQTCIPVTPTIGILAFLMDGTTMTLDISYQVTELVNQNYSVTGQVVEAVNGIPTGQPKNFEVSIPANSTTTNWIVKPDLQKQFGGKFMFINVGKVPTTVIGDITIVNEF